MLKRTPLKKSSKPLKRSPIKPRVKSEEEIEKKKRESEKMKFFFLYAWESLPHYSQISGKWLGGEIKTIFMHHTFEKSPFPELKYSITNILMVSGDEHSMLNGDVEYYSQAVERRKYIRENWEKCVAESREWEEMFDNMKNNM